MFKRPAVTNPIGTLSFDRVSKKQRRSLCIETFPTEILIRIFSYLPTEPSKYWYYLALVSRRFNPVANIFLYRTYTYTGHENGVIFTSSLLRRQHLAGLVKFVDLGTCTYELGDCDASLSIPCPTQEQSSLINERLRQLPHHQPASASRGSTVEQAETIVLLTLLLCRTTAVETLIAPRRRRRIPLEYGERVEAYKRPEFFYDTLPVCLDPLVCLATGTPYWTGRGLFNGFTRLRKLVLDMRGTRAEAMSCLFNISTLQDLTIENLEDWGLERSPRPDWECQPASSAVENLKFGTALASSKTVAKAIEACKALKDFSYSERLTHDEGIHCEGREGYREGWYMDVTKALRIHRNTLEYLQVEDDLCCVCHDILGPFQEDFPRLKYLKAPLYLLLGVEDGATPMFWFDHIHTTRNDYRSRGWPVRTGAYMDLLPPGLETLYLTLNETRSRHEGVTEILPSLEATCLAMTQLKYLFMEFGIPRRLEDGGLRITQAQQLKNRLEGNGCRGIHFDYTLDFSRYPVCEEDCMKRRHDCIKRDTPWLNENYGEWNRDWRSHMYHCDSGGYEIRLPQRLRRD